MSAVANDAPVFSPDDFPEASELAALNVHECTELAHRIRRFLIDVVPRTGGHIGANLSTVELTIALHRVFRSPQTSLIWDTGHQAYTHKILTGRSGQFSTLRARRGLSGFPSRHESPHDVLENSHASVGPAWGYGVSLAVNRLTVVILGDGALTGGVAFEGLNAIGFRRAPVLVVFNDNGRSYAPTESRLTCGEPEFSTDPQGPAACRAFFEALGFTYYEPVSGHDVEALDAALERGKNGPLPSVVHVRTQKGKGWSAALDDAEKRLHDVAPGERGPRASGQVSLGWSDVVGGMLCDLASDDARVHVLTAAMPDTLRLTAFRDTFPGRYHDLGICEQACVAAAAGLASQGMRPFFVVVATFLTRAIDQIIYDVALHRLPVVFLIDRAGITGSDGPSHHGLYDVGLLRNVPGIEVHSVTTPDDLAVTLRSALARNHGPVAVRYPKGCPSSYQAPAPSRLERREGSTCLIGHGATATVVREAAEILASRHRVLCSVCCVSQVHPLDPGVLEEAARHKLVITVEDVAASGALAREIAYALASDGRLAPGGVLPRVKSIALPAGFLPHGSRADLLNEFGITASNVVNAVRMELLRAPA